MPGKRFTRALGCTLLITALAACGSTTDQTPPSGMSIAVITPNLEHDYFKSVQGDALDEGATQGVSITQVTDAADEVSQIKAIQAAIDSGTTGIVIYPAGAAVAGSVQKARDAGLVVIELGGSPTPTGKANLVISADDCTLGTAIGQWVAGKLNSYPGNIARVTGPLTPTSAPPAATCRDTAFLQGMGIETGDPNKQGDEPASGRYTGGYAGDFTLPCLVTTATDAETARSALADCFTAGKTIDTVYAASDS
ncbi:MAG: substrate-binding domain-containing protein, partial [Actinomycetales bacterium]|nr:substrate-binding domain-containing protein [Actinomycetales bacterium]